jgi:hypothetical protein
MTAENLTAEQLAALLAAVRNHLVITWTDAALDTRLTGYIKRGITRINDLGGMEFDYSKEETPRDLLMERCRYFRSNAGDQFESDFRSEIISLRLGQEVAQYEADDTEV